jgi:hypothetical protein
MLVILVTCGVIKDCHNKPNSNRRSWLSNNVVSSSGITCYCVHGNCLHALFSRPVKLFDIE